MTFSSTRTVMNFPVRRFFFFKTHWRLLTMQWIMTLFEVHLLCQVLLFLKLYDGLPHLVSFAYIWAVFGFFWQVEPWYSLLETSSLMPLECRSIYIDLPLGEIPTAGCTGMPKALRKVWWQSDSSQVRRYVFTYHLPLTTTTFKEGWSVTIGHRGWK